MNQFGRSTDVSGFEFKTTPTADVSSDERALMHELFDACYRQANHDHLDKSLKVLRYVSFAWRDGKPAAFAMADSLVIDLPRLPRWLLAQVISARRATRARKIYAKIGGGSPLLANTEAQAAALASALAQDGLDGARCFVAMRYWHPMSAATAQAVKAYHRLQQLLTDELGTDPSKETEALYLELLG